jgi:hypothetical protein
VEIIQSDVKIKVNGEERNVDLYNGYLPNKKHAPRL